MKNKLKVGIVGAPRGQSFIRSFQAIEETDVIAICDLNIDVVEGVASQFNIDQKYTEFEEMVQSDLDIVVVSTPMPLHAPQSTLALQEGKHVISEVPAATDLQQCWELAKSVENSKKKYMMAENCVYTKPNILIRELAMQGLFGDIYFGEGQYIHELKSLNEITKWRRKWQTGRNGCTYSTHSLGPVLQWFEDRVCTVSCFGSGHHYEDSEGKQYENEDTISMIYKTTRGGLVEIRVDMYLIGQPGGNIVVYRAQKGATKPHVVLEINPKFGWRNTPIRSPGSRYRISKNNICPRSGEIRLWKLCKLAMEVAIILKSENLLTQLSTIPNHQLIFMSRWT